MAQNAIAGIAYVAVDGRSIRLVGEATYKVSGEKRETMAGMDGIHGFKATPDTGNIKFKARDASDVSVKTLNDLTDSTITLELVNGKTIVARNAWRDGELLEVDTSEGSFEITFASTDVSEQ